MMRLRYMSEDERQRRLGVFMAGVKAIRTPPKETPSPDALSATSLKVLVKAALEPGIRLLAIYESLGFHPAEGKRAVDDLVARGLVRVHRLVRQGRGAQPQVLEVLLKGVAELEKRGIVPALKKVKRGGFRHDVYARVIEQWARANGFVRMEFERTLGEKAFDLVMERGHQAGELVGVEIVLSGTAKWNAGQALKAASVEGVSEVIVACEDRKLMKGIEAELAEQDGLGLYRGKISIRHLSEFMRNED